MPALSIRTAQAPSATQTIRPSQKHFIFRSSFANKHSQNNDVFNQSIMNMPTSILQSIRRLLPKQKIPAKFNTISATINTIHNQITPLKVPYVPFSPNRYRMYISSTSSLLVLSTPEKHYKFFGCTKTVWFEHGKHTFNLPGVIVCISAPPVPFWSCLHQKNTTTFSITNSNLNMKTHFRTTTWKRLRIPSRTNLRWYYLRVSTLTANKSPTI